MVDLIDNWQRAFGRYSEQRGSAPAALGRAGDCADHAIGPGLLPDVAGCARRRTGLGSTLLGRRPFSDLTDHMLDKFPPGRAMDYQRTYGSGGKINPDYIDFGNYHYGAVSAAAGYTLDEAQMGAGAANLLGSENKSGTYFGNPHNQAMIASGWRAYMQGKIGG